MLLKVLREEKLVAGIKEFVKKELGIKFIESPPFDLEGSFNDSVSTVIINYIFI